MKKRIAACVVLVAIVSILAAGWKYGPREDAGSPPDDGAVPAAQPSSDKSSATPVITSQPIPDPSITDQERQDHLRILGEAVVRYLRQNEGRLPAGIGDLYREGLILDREVFVAPGRPAPAEDRIDASTSYAIVALLTNVRPLMLVWEKQPSADGRRLGFYSDRSIRPAGTTPASAPTVTGESKPVPTLVGLRVAEAKKKLNESGFETIRLVAAHDSPPAKEKEFTVQRHEQDGRIATLHIYPRFVDAGTVLPSIVGLKAPEAKKRLVAAGFTNIAFVAADESAPSDDQRHCVRNQDPPAGVSVNTAARIKLSVYSGGDPTMEEKWTGR